jgi:hypothetical protein
MHLSSQKAFKNPMNITVMQIQNSSATLQTFEVDA